MLTRSHIDAAQETIGGLMEILAAFPLSFMAEGREFHEAQERDLFALKAPRDGDVA